MTADYPLRFSVGVIPLNRTNFILFTVYPNEFPKGSPCHGPSPERWKYNIKEWMSNELSSITLNLFNSSDPLDVTHQPTIKAMLQALIRALADAGVLTD